jgi:hypothetical protein
LTNKYRKAFSFWRTNGTRATLHRVRAEFARRAEQTSIPFMHPTPVVKDAAQTVQARFSANTPLQTYLLPPSTRRRVSVVTDSIGAGSLFGGVGTALIFASLLANRLQADLRIITRGDRAKPEPLAHLLNVYGIELKGESQFRFAPAYDTSQDIDFQLDELFITTSWWTTAATVPSIPAASIIYLLQEDERMFYPFGDDHQRCQQMLRNNEIRFLINTRLLFEHLVASGLGQLSQRALWFEPAFPSEVFKPRAPQPQAKRKFLFYARPHNVRNLFYLGIEVIEAAIEQQVLDLDHWDIVLVGKDIPEIRFGRDYLPQRLENLSWQTYAELVGSVELGLSLMYTPHPSYPPLDLAASGAVVVTNQFGIKRDLSDYSRNLICVPCDRQALVEGLRQGVRLADDRTTREANFRGNGLGRDWQRSFAAALDSIAEGR